MFEPFDIGDVTVLLWVAYPAIEWVLLSLILVV